MNAATDWTRSVCSITLVFYLPLSMHSSTTLLAAAGSFMATTLCRIHFQHVPLCAAVRDRAAQYGSCSSMPEVGSLVTASIDSLSWGSHSTPWSVELCDLHGASPWEMKGSLGLSNHRSSCSVTTWCGSRSALVHHTDHSPSPRPTWIWNAEE